MDFDGARPINAPYEYVGYQVVFTYSTFKKWGAIYGDT
jgi:hypothetical protein